MRRSSMLVALLAALLALGVACGFGGWHQPAGPAAGPSAAVPSAGDVDVRAENTRPGASCGLRDTGTPHEVEGWLDAASIRPGEPVRLYASTTARSLSVSAFRVGWYDGRKCRLVMRVDGLPGHRQPAPTVAPKLHTATARWAPTLTLTTRDWPPGDYLLRLDASSGAQRYVPLTVRGPGAVGRVVILNAVTTWQAYNAWGGYSLYHGLYGFADRGRAVSFDRPYDYGAGAADLTGNEMPLVSLAERLGLPLDYATDLDLHHDPHLLDDARAVVSLGHDEYYSPAMRTALTRARDRGTSIAFLGANAVHRRVRLAPTGTGPDRLEIGYKIASEDPLFGVDDGQVTADWPSPPRARPQSELTGGMYQCNPVHDDLVVWNPEHWLLAGTGARRGDTFPGLVGPEYDRVDLAFPTPRDIEVLAHSPVVCDGRADHSDVSYYTTGSGAGVFDSGTSAWVCAIDDVCGPGTGGARARAFVTRVTTTLLSAFAAGPAGALHPAARAVPSDAAG